MDGYEARRLANIKRNAELVHDLGLEDNKPEQEVKAPPSTTTISSKRRKLDPAPPTRTSRRLASASSRPTTYNEDALQNALVEPTAESNDRRPRSTKTKKGASKAQKTKAPSPPTTTTSKHPDLDSIVAGWTSWTPIVPPPTRDETTGEYHFESHPTFRPNKSPESILREGAFGGTYFRPLYSKRLGTTIADDWRELPQEWTSGGGINVETQLTSTEYDPQVNKYGVGCGQSIEEWEAAGWIAHEYDVRGWFQWYCRFWMGRRISDGSGEDERQISRWRKCVGETGRWRRILLKKYVQMGVRSVFDDGDEDDEERGEVSPVVHQTCHHWAYEVRQEALDRFWAEGK
ncbi:hypothetical protein PG993_009026 [Apiospora rasikravindrae]|uniref:Vegetatible incompatibility protein HET-E-1 n=1 Tax=Apiospora rasikravindrae TaxID=990691 RepID=A0ABR1SI69_9PEZI